METPQPTQEQSRPSPLDQLRFDVIEAQTEKLLPWADEMGDSGYIISIDDAKSVVEATIQELDGKGMFVQSPNYDDARELVDDVAEHLDSGQRNVTLTGAVDTTLSICLNSKLLNEKSLKEE
jgi:hypothetical protein